MQIFLIIKTQVLQVTHISLCYIRLLSANGVVVEGKQRRVRCSLCNNIAEMTQAKYVQN